MFSLLRSAKKAMGFTKYTHQVLEHIQTIYGDDMFTAVSTYLQRESEIFAETKKSLGGNGALDQLIDLHNKDFHADAAASAVVSRLNSLPDDSPWSDWCKDLIAARDHEVQCFIDSNTGKN